MDTKECQPLSLDIRKFYKRLNMKIVQQISLLLVERPALNEVMDGENNSQHQLPETEGLCLLEEQIVSTILRRPRIGVGNQIIVLITGPHRLIRRCEVTTILLLFGLPSPKVEEGICQVLAHMWLDFELIASSGSSCKVSSSSSISTSLPSSSLVSLTSSGSSKKGEQSRFERKLGEFFKYRSSQMNWWCMRMDSEEEPKQQDRELSLSKSKLVLYSYLLLLSCLWWSLALMLMSPKP
ncbi:hypothetical protein Nepgr_021633 [Nepenthes gracilis]|uniref:Protein DA1-like domain-containing protein n=1 Tax=Nepenthes gracilis TaxID=150966 RepID=A0AAD3SZ42_NEPGR|nr:hypothetical protein Nepgr_021633 [Nepenthes gracilis]